MVRVNREASASPQQDPAVATLADGGFVVTWLGAGPAGVASGVWARRFGADDAPAGREIKVNQALNGEQYQPEVAALPDGGFVVGWFDAASVSRRARAPPWCVRSGRTACRPAASCRRSRLRRRSPRRRGRPWPRWATTSTW